MKKLTPFTAVVFEPSWSKKKTKGSIVYSKYPLKYGDKVIYLGEITNALGHGIYCKYSGEIITMLHLNDFRKATEDEV